jgi:hypothetical protein
MGRHTVEGERGIVGERQPTDGDVQDALEWARLRLTELGFIGCWTGSPQRGMEQAGQGQAHEKLTSGRGGRLPAAPSACPARVGPVRTGPTLWLEAKDRLTYQSLLVLLSLSQLLLPP